MIYTVGYERLTAARVVELLDYFSATLIDVRGVPHSRKSGFGARQLPQLVGAHRYQWWPDLGNHGGHRVTPRALDRLAGVRSNVLLMCLEEEPLDCHRHILIAEPLSRRGVKVTHVYRDQLIDAAELERADRADGKYEYDPLDLPFKLAR